MGWNNPPVPWKKLEQALSGVTPLAPATRRASDAAPDAPAHAPAASLAAPGDSLPAPETVVPYAELHAHSYYSFLDGASSPEELVAEASRVGLSGLALTDHNGLYGAVRLAESATAHPLTTVFGAELSLDLPAPQNGVPDPEGSHLLVLARGEEGYHRLAGALTTAHLAEGAEKGRPRYDLDELAHAAAGSWVVLTGCRKGAVRQALRCAGPEAAGSQLEQLIHRFGHENVVVELTDHGRASDTDDNDALAELARIHALPTIATGAVHYATPDRARVAAAVAAVRAHRSLDELDGWLPASGAAFVRSGAEMQQRFRRYPGAVARTAPLAAELGFPLRAVRPRLPQQDVPAGHTPMSWLSELVWQGVGTFYPNADESVRSRIRKELAVIDSKDFAGYFLIVHDIVRFARGRGILCQGRGSAANSAVCYALGITAVDSIFYDLPFERFLSSLREEEPDIDVDFDSDRREEVIQYVYRKYGRRCAAQVANVITYRPKNAVRDMAKALGFSPGQQDAWSRQVEGWREISADGTDIPDAGIALAQQVRGFPRHLGIHSGGMVLTDRPVGEICPIEPARMPGRTVLQWDKDDCAYMGLVKFDLLGLGMLAALQYAFDLIADTLGERWTVGSIPREEEGVFDMLCRADAVGIFQVESRAQMATLPRLKPRRYYDLVVEIALIRPGPIQGGAVHPYIRRRTGEEKVSYPHPLLEPVLERTLGVPLFQEQLMQMAVAVGGCTAEDADLLRRAMGSKRGVEKIDSLREKLFAGMAANGISPEVAADIYGRIQAFANFGFAESHSLSFAVLVYASSWIKLHYPAAFLAALLRAQPMGFYAPHTLVADARRHGVQVLRPDIVRSGVHASLEAVGSAEGPTGPAQCRAFVQPPVGPFRPDSPDPTREHRLDGNHAVRQGLATVTGIGVETATRIVAERDSGGPYLSQGDLSRRVGLSTEQVEALSSAGAFAALGLGAREAVWSAGVASRERPGHLAGAALSIQPPLLAVLSPAEQIAYDLWSTGVSPDDHPLSQVRDRLHSASVLPIEALSSAEPGRRIRVGGVVTHRQRPATASGITFLNLEDETGMLNVVVSRGVWARHLRVMRESPALIVRGVLERSADGVIALVADGCEPLPLGVRTTSRDFR